MLRMPKHSRQLVPWKTSTGEGHTRKEYGLLNDLTDLELLGLILVGAILFTIVFRVGSRIVARMRR